MKRLPPFLYDCSDNHNHHHHHQSDHRGQQQLQNNDPTQNVAQLSIASTFAWRVPPPRPPPIELQPPQDETQHNPGTVRAGRASPAAAATVAVVVEGRRTDDDDEGGEQDKEKQKDRGQVVEAVPEMKATTASFRYVTRMEANGRDSSSDDNSGDKQAEQYEIEQTPVPTSLLPALALALASTPARVVAPVTLALSSLMSSQEQQQQQLPYSPPRQPQPQSKQRPPPTAAVLRVSRRDGKLLGKMQKGTVKRPLMNATSSASMPHRGHSSIDVGVALPPSASTYAAAHAEREWDRWGQSKRERKQDAEVMARLNRLEKVLAIAGDGDNNLNANQLKKKNRDHHNEEDGDSDDDDDDDDSDDDNDDDEHQNINYNSNNNQSHQESEDRSESKLGSMPISKQESKPTSVKLKAMIETMMSGLQNEVALMKGSIDQLITLVLKLYCGKSASTHGTGASSSGVAADKGMRVANNTDDGVSDAVPVIVPKTWTKNNTENDNDNAEVRRLLMELKQRLDSMSSQLVTYERDKDKVVQQMTEYGRVCSVLSEAVRQTDDSLITAVCSLIVLARPALADALVSSLTQSQPVPLQQLQQRLQQQPLQQSAPAQEQQQQQMQLQQPAQQQQKQQLYNSEDSNGHNDVAGDWRADKQRKPLKLPPRSMPRTAREAKERRKGPVMLRLRLRRKTDRKKENVKDHASRWGGGPQVIVMKKTMVGKPMKKRRIVLCRQQQQQGLQC